MLGGRVETRFAGVRREDFKLRFADLAATYSPAS